MEYKFLSLDLGHNARIMILNAKNLNIQQGTSIFDFFEWLCLFFYLVILLIPFNKLPYSLFD